MQKLVRLLVGAVALSSLCAGAQDAGPKRQEFTPKAGNGRVVVVISGQTGMANYTATAQQIAGASASLAELAGNLESSAELAKARY